MAGPHCQSASGARAPALSAMSTRSRLPNAWKMKIIPRMSPASPMRFTTNAFRPAAEALSLRYQNPISRYEQSPTPSQPMKRSGRLPPSTSSSMKNVKRFRYEK